MPRTSPDWIPKEQRKKLRCKDCRGWFPPTDFVSEGHDPQSGYKRYSSRCKSCYKIHSKEQWKSKKTGYSFPKKKQDKIAKRELVASVKKECSVCGYDKCKEALDFHHKADNKEAGISKLTFGSASLKRLEREIAKCVVLCCRCHREHHAGMLDIGD